MWQTACNASQSSNKIRARASTGFRIRKLLMILIKAIPAVQVEQEQDYGKTKHKYALSTVRETKLKCKSEDQWEDWPETEIYFIYETGGKRSKWVQMCGVNSEKQVNQRCSYIIAFYCPCNFMNDYTNQYPCYLARWS